MKANDKVIYNNKEGIIYDITKDGMTVWVETNEDIYKVSASEVELIQVNTKGHSASISFSKYEDEYSDSRHLAIDLAVKGLNATQVFNLIAEQMESDLNINFLRCPEVEEGMHIDSFTIDYDHGEMGNIKKEITNIFKSIKKKLGVR